MGKIITGAIAALVIILAVLVGVFYFNLDKVIIAAVEKYGTEVTQSEVTLAGAEVDLTSGAGALQGLKVGNPKGFAEPSAFELGEIALAVNLSETNEKLIHIKEIVVDGPAITYEVNETSNNLDEIKKNIDSFIAANSSGSSSEAKSDEEGPKLIIDKLVIKNGKVTVKAPITLNKTIEGTLPTIQMTDIGKDKGGATPAEVAAQLSKKVTDGALGVVGKLGIGKTLGSLKNALGGAAGAAAGAVEKGLKGATGGAGSAVEGAAGAIKGILKQ